MPFAFRASVWICQVGMRLAKNVARRLHCSLPARAIDFGERRHLRLPWCFGLVGVDEALNYKTLNAAQKSRYECVENVPR
jgi:hypothetical protein